MTASAVFILDVKGKVIISRNYRGDVPMNCVERFAGHVLEAEEADERPVWLEHGTTYVYIKYNNLYIMAVTQRNSNAAMILLFLYRLVEARGARAVRWWRRQRRAGVLEFRRVGQQVVPQHRRGADVRREEVLEKARRGDRHVALAQRVDARLDAAREPLVNRVGRQVVSLVSRAHARERARLCAQPRGRELRHQPLPCRCTRGGLQRPKDCLNSLQRLVTPLHCDLQRSLGWCWIRWRRAPNPSMIWQRER